MADAVRRRRMWRPNPGVALGLLLGTCADRGLDKLTLIVSPRIYDLGAWLEQLVAESTGKNGHAHDPRRSRSAAGSPDAYGADRVFVVPAARDRARRRAGCGRRGAGAGGPAGRADRRRRTATALAGEFFRWEIATAVAGAVMGINPFDQPDVEASKIETRKLTAEFEKTGALPAGTPVSPTTG